MNSRFTFIRISTIFEKYKCWIAEEKLFESFDTKYGYKSTSKLSFSIFSTHQRVQRRHSGLLHKFIQKRISAPASAFSNRWNKSDTFENTHAQMNENGIFYRVIENYFSFFDSMYPCTAAEARRHLWQWLGLNQVPFGRKDKHVVTTPHKLHCWRILILLSV